MKIKSQRDFGAGLMFLAVGVSFALGASTYDFGVSARPGPGYFPMLLGLILAVLGALVLFKALTLETEDGEPIGKLAWKPLITILGSVVLFGLLLPRVGLAVALPLLVFGASAAGDEFSLRDATISAVVLTGLAWLLFIKGLALTLPLWPAFLG